MNTWWKVSDLLDGEKTMQGLERPERALEVVLGSEMPEEVKAEAAELAAEIAHLKERLKAHSQHVLSKMDGVMWPVLR